MRLATLTTKTKTIKKPQLKKAGAFDKSTTAQMQRKSTLIFLDQFHPLSFSHADYLFCKRHTFNTNYFGITFEGMPESLNFDQMDYIVSQPRLLRPFDN